MEKGKVAVIMGSDSDMPVMRQAWEVLDRFKVKYEIKVLSAHRTPRETKEFAENARDKNFSIIIAAAGAAAHLAGVIASLTTIPVIGVPVETKSLKGLDSLLSTVQMPPGIPVASMAIGGAKNAALFAVEILSLNDNDLVKKLFAYRQEMSKLVLKKNKGLKKLGLSK